MWGCLLSGYTCISRLQVLFLAGCVVVPIVMRSCNRHNPIMIHKCSWGCQGQPYLKPSNGTRLLAVRRGEQAPGLFGLLDFYDNSMVFSCVKEHSKPFQTLSLEHPCCLKTLESRSPEVPEARKIPRFQCPSVYF